MKLHKTPIHGAYRVELAAFFDTRGAFAEAFVRDKFYEQGVRFDPVMMNMSLTEKAGTVRGMHWQAKPFSQGKIVFSMRGRIFDAIVDVRRGSPTFGAVFHLELQPQKNALFIPKGVAHGCQAQEDQAMLVYLLDNAYKPTHERGLRPDDPEVAVPWPLPPVHVARRDLSWPTLSEIAKQDDQPLHLYACGHEQHCRCERDADGRCASCLEVVTEFVKLVVQNLKEQQERLNEGGKDLEELCDVCSRETADFMLSRIAKNCTDSTAGIVDTEQAVPYMLSALQVIKDAIGKMKGVRDWPLFEKTAAEATDRMQRQAADEE